MIPIVDLTQQPISPGTTPVYEGQLVDQNGVPLPGSSLATFTLTIADTITKAIVNSVQDVNILNVGRGTIDNSGNIAVTLQVADTQMLIAGDVKERRSLILTWTWNGGANKQQREVRFLIEALSGT